jgi:hypothetical protein
MDNRFENYGGDAVVWEDTRRSRGGCDPDGAASSINAETRTRWRAGTRSRPIGLDPYVDGPLLARCLQRFDQIVCVHMSGLSMRSHMNAGQDGFRDTGSKQQGDL